MARRVSEALRFIEQAKFSITREKLARKENCAENLLAYSNQYGLVFLAKESELLVFSLLDLEANFEGSKERELDDAAIRCSKEFAGKICFIALSQEAEFLSVVVENDVFIYHISNFQAKVRF